MIPIISFNILTREYYNKYDSDKNINNDFRKRFIFFLLNKWTTSELKPLIALQEVTGEWKDDIDKIFINNGYNYFSMNYGFRGNGYFGVVSAVPKKYKVLDINYINIPNLFKNNSNLIQEEIIDDLLKTNHFLIQLILKDTKPFIFYNYHLPVPKNESINQIIHAVTLKKLMCNMKNYPIIWAGDFNIKPDSEIYNFIKKNRITLKIKNIEFPDCNLEFESSYKSFHGSEPFMTTHTKNFRETLDYIFITKQFKCINSKVLQYNEEIMPNKYNPSDHLPLISLLVLN
jgi:endonuclease/exonuclease/phosphatase family metal-dependent hydrolase